MEKLGQLYNYVYPFAAKAVIPKNFLDITIVAILVFLALLLLKKTKAVQIIIGITLLAGVYGVGVIFDLEATQKIFQSFFGTLLIIFVVIFQKEIKRFFEFIGVLGTTRKILPPTDMTIKVLIQAVLDLSHQKTGAIIVISGKENFEQHLTGGFNLDGKVSRPLLLSIFDSSSPGHDGAVIINGDKIKKFAVRLPLSDNPNMETKYGTRHLSALSLSEITDALIIVVSEETGSISLAFDKKLFRIKSDMELEYNLDNFMRMHSPFYKSSRYFAWTKRNFLLVLVSFIIAFAFWVVFFVQDIVITQKRFVVPIEFMNITPNYYVEEGVHEVIITVSGKEGDFKSFNSKDLKLSIDMGKIKPGKHPIIIKKEEILNDPNFPIVKVDPDNIMIELLKQKPPPPTPTPTPTPTP